MGNREKNCRARQHSDQMMCGECALAWDVNDPDPPQCPRHTLARDAVFEMRNILSTASSPSPLLELREFPLNWLPSCGVSECLLQVNWSSHPEFGFVVVSRPQIEMCQARDYLFYSKSGGPLVEVQIREDFSGRRANIREVSGSVKGQWVSA